MEWTRTEIEQARAQIDVKDSSSGRKSTLPKNNLFATRSEI
jgi:hypothetical protein